MRITGYRKKVSEPELTFVQGECVGKPASSFIIKIQSPNSCTQLGKTYLVYYQNHFTIKLGPLFFLQLILKRVKKRQKGIHILHNILHIILYIIHMLILLYIKYTDYICVNHTIYIYYLVFILLSSCYIMLCYIMICYKFK